LAPLESLVRVAVSERVPVPATREVGMEEGFVVREIDGVVVPPPPPPLELLEPLLQPTRAAIMLKLIRRRIDWLNVLVRDVIAHLR
jgi:hypothetical protein